MSGKRRSVLVGVVLTGLAFGCAAVSADDGKLWESRMRDMVEEQLRSRGIRDERVLEAMGRVPRHLFVDPDLADLAYEDAPLPIGHDQTISQPYVVAYMTELAAVKPGDRVLEVGTGSGYQAAVLGEIAREVYTVEIIEPLAQKARETLAKLGLTRVHVRHGDGHKGWPQKAPFDVILVTAAANEVPPALVDQLKTGGRMVIPIGSVFQFIYLVTKTEKGIEKKELLPVRFVPMVKGD